MGRGVFEKKIRSRHGTEALLHPIVQYPPPSQPPFIAYTILRNIQYIFPTTTTPFILYIAAINKY